MADEYQYSREELMRAFVGMHFPERSAREDGLIVEFLQHHITEFDTFSFSVRVGTGQAPNPDHLPGVQRQTVRNSQMRIDMLLKRGAQPFIFEVKERANHAALGQLQTYGHLYQKAHPDEPAPRFGVIARTIEPDMVSVFAAAGIPVYLYEAANSSNGVAGGGTSPVNGPAA